MLTFNLLDMNTVSHNNYGLWRDPRNQKVRYCDIDYWVAQAQACERAMMDCVFFADVLGVAAGYGGNNDVTLRNGMHVPTNDPLTIISAMAAETKSIGLGATVSTTYELPFAHARRFSTLDHMTEGRIAWNVVTSYLPNANENYGVPHDRYTHDERYDLADEFIQVCYKLWEGSWEEDAVVADRIRGIYADPAKVHRIDHAGRYFNVAGPHLSEPSPQRTPVIFQAGSSDKGLEFAARNAEVIFVGGRTNEAHGDNVRKVRAMLRSIGRPESEVRIIADASFVVGRTEEDARHKLAEYQALSQADGYLAHQFGSGANLMAYDPSRTLADIIAEGGPGAGHMSRYPYPPETTVGEVLHRMTRLENRPLFTVGDPVQVVDTIERWVEDYGFDGFLVRQFISPGTAEDFANYLTPELARRGLIRTSYAGKTMRGRMFGNDRLPSGHPAAAWRGAFGNREAAL
jgi:FMN-dependent oxidoreductase (nitrilotriacetate monooxygenase family)